MSRIGKKPIRLSSGVKVDIKGHHAIVSGPKGKLEHELPGCIRLEQDGDLLRVSCDDESMQGSAFHGMARSLLQGMITGVETGFRKELEIQGVGYRGQCAGKKITLTLGYSHPVEFRVPEDVEISMPAPNRILLESINKQVLGQTAATIRGFRPPDSFKGKGIRYVGEQITLKEGKSVG